MGTGVDVGTGVEVGVGVIDGFGSSVAVTVGVEVRVGVLEAPPAVGVMLAVAVGVLVAEIAPTARAALMRPYCQRVPVPDIASALAVIRSTTCCGVVAPEIVQTSAARPATCGAAIEVPLRSLNPVPGTDDRIPSPGANSVRNGAAFEKIATSSPFVVAPTLIADEMQAGDEIALPAKLLPDATMLAIPRARRLSIAGLYGWSSQNDWNVVLPRLMLTATTFNAAGEL